MNLLELYQTKKYRTDKNTTHSYINHLYNSLFLDKRQSATNVLEIGVHHGGSILLWRDYFINATIDAIDIHDCYDKLDTDRINHIVSDAYNVNVIENLKNYDIIIDDGPHTLNSIYFIIDNYLSLLKNNGICIIEDIQDYSWFEYITSKIPKQYSFNIVDLRSIKNRYDDMILVIRKEEV